MKYRFSKTSLSRLYTCDQRLVLLMLAAINDPRCPVDFTVLEGQRTIEQQARNVANGSSKTMNSRHLWEPSGAVDVAPYPVDWQDEARFGLLAGHIKTIRDELNLPIDWGFDLWGWDMPHWQIREK